MMNSCQIVGRLAQDPQLRTTTTGKLISEFSVAIEKPFKPVDGSRECDFFRVTAWGRTADYVANYLTKGRLVALNGRLALREYSDGEGRKREMVYIIADSVHGLDRPRDEAASAEAEEDQEPALFEV